MKAIISLLLAMLLLCVLVSATPERDKAIAYAESHNWQLPTTEIGWEALEHKANGFCEWTRSRDGRVFQGVMGRLSDGTYICFSPGPVAKKVAPSVVVTYTPEPEPEPEPEPTCEEVCHEHCSWENVCQHWNWWKCTHWHKEKTCHDHCETICD